MVKKRRKKPNTSRTVFWIVALLVIAALFAGHRFWSCIFNPSPQFNHILISSDGNPLTILKGEEIRLHPKNRIKILEVSTNLCLNFGVRLTAREIDISALMYEEVSLSDLLPDRDIFNRYSIRVEVKRRNQDLGYIDIVAEPFVDDWLDKANRTIDSTKRVSVLESARKLAPEDKRIRERLIREYIALKRFDAAAVMLEEMVKDTPDRSLLSELLKVYQAMGKNDKVISVLRRIVKLNPDDGDARLELATIFEKTGRLKDAIKEYEELLGIVSKENLAPVYENLGFLYTKNKSFKKAIDAYLNALKTGEEDVNIYYNLSFLYEKIGKKEEAEEYLAKAVKLKAGDTEGRLKLAESLIRKDKLKEAEEYLTEVLKKSPKSKEALMFMADIAEKRGDKKRLKSVYKRILSVDPRNKTVIYNLGIIEYETGNLVSAVKYLKKYVKSNPKDSGTRIILFDIYRKQKKEDLAYGEARAIIRLKRKEIDYYHYVFEYLNARGKYKDLVKVMTYGIKANPKSIDLRKYLLLAYLKTGKDDLAITQIKEILAMNPEDIKMLLQLANLQEKEGRSKEALATYKKIIDISPGHEEAEESYLRLRFEGLPHD